MRQFEERKAEVFRRSNERIRARKLMTRSILSLSIVFVLCAVTLALTKHPTPPLTGDGSNGSTTVTTGTAQPTEEGDREFRESLSSPLIPETVVDGNVGILEATVTVTQGDTKQIYQDEEIVWQVLSMIRSVVSEDNNVIPSDSDPAYGTSSVTITVTDTTERVYLLTGNVLTDREKDLHYKVPDETLETLNRTLNLN